MKRYFKIWDNAQDYYSKLTFQGKQPFITWVNNKYCVTITN